MSTAEATLQAREPDARYLAAVQPTLVRQFGLLATALGGVARLRELILTLAVQGKLVSQDTGDEPASVLLQRIIEEQRRLIAEGSIKKERSVSPIDEDEIPFALPAGWVWTRVGTALPFRIGKTPPSKDSRYWSDSGFSWVSISDMTHFGEVLETTRKVTQHGADVFGYEPLPPGTLLMSFKLTIGKIAVLRIPAYHNEAIASFLPLGGTNIEFLKYVLPTVSRTGVAKNALMGQTLNTDSISDLLIALPPLPEQARIVARVDDLMRLCDALEAQGRLEAEQHARLLGTLLGTLTDSSTPEELAANWQRVADHFDLLLDRPKAVDALEQTILQLAVRGLLVPQDPSDEPASFLLERIRAEKDRLIAEGRIKREKPSTPASEEDPPYTLPDLWAWARVAHLGITTTGGTPPSNRPECFGDGTPFIGPGQICPHGAILPAEKFVSKLGCLETSIAEKGDVMMVCIGGSIGKCAKATEVTAFNQQINSIRTHFGSGEYVLAAMRSLDFQHRVISAATGSATPIISKGKWDLLLLPLPPAAEQTRIVARVTELRHLCADLRQRLTASQTTQSHLAEALVEQAAA